MLGGTQSLHTNSYDEVPSPPSTQRNIALRTQQVLGYETGVAESVDPLGGSYYVEALTDELEGLATELVERIDATGGAVAAIEAGLYQDEHPMQGGVPHPAGDRNGRSSPGRGEPVRRRDCFPSSSNGSRRRRRRVRWRLRALRASRDQAAVDAVLARVEETARGTASSTADAGGAGGTGDPRRGLGRASRTVFGEYRPTH